MSGTPTGLDNRNLIRKIFISEDEPRLRAGWRLLVQTFFLLAIGNCVGIPLVIYLAGNGIVTLNINPIGSEILLPLQIAELIMITSSIFLARRFLDKRSFTSLGLTLNIQAIQDILTGVIFTFFMMGSIYLLESTLGWLTFEAFAWQIDPINTVIARILIFFVIFILAGWNEELLFRGYYLQTIASGMNTFWGVVVSSALFGIIHLTNPNATWVSAAGIFPAGLLFAYAYMRTGQLWLPVGLHIGWNLFEGVVFGFPVSGLDIYQLLRIQVRGPVLWTGGSFGPEAGLIVIPGLLLGTALIYIYTRTRQKTVI